MASVEGSGYVFGPELNVTDPSNNETNGSKDDDSVASIVSLNFVDSFVKSFSVMLVSELGDKTFFLAGESNCSGLFCQKNAC